MMKEFSALIFECWWNPVASDEIIRDPQKNKQIWQHIITLTSVLTDWVVSMKKQIKNKQSEGTSFV